jgi:hypothetical protein
VCWGNSKQCTIHQPANRNQSLSFNLGMQGQCVPDRCVPGRKFLDVAPHEQFIPDRCVLTQEGIRGSKQPPAGEAMGLSVRLRLRP